MYTHSKRSFELLEPARAAGYCISYKEVVPIKVEPVGDLLERLLSEVIELRFTRVLNPIRENIILSKLDFSIIRFRNAKKI